MRLVKERTKMRFCECRITESHFDRLQKLAMRLVKERKTSLREIAQICNFCTTNHFIIPSYLRNNDESALRHKRGSPTVLTEGDLEGIVEGLIFPDKTGFPERNDFKIYNFTDFTKQTSDLEAWRAFRCCA